MLTIHQSNRLEALVDELAALTRQPLGSPFAGEVIVVQSRGVARWLALRLADRAGVCANVRFPFPTAFAWELYRSVCGGVPEQSAWDPEVLTWRILGVLPELESLPLFAPVHAYVRGDALRRYELAARLAALFDEYLVYRPDWIADWEREKPAHEKRERGKLAHEMRERGNLAHEMRERGNLAHEMRERGKPAHEKREKQAHAQPDYWQAALWQRLAQDAGAPHRAALHMQLLQALASPSATGAVPERVSIFGAPALPPTLLELYTALARVSDVHLFVQNPCREYWGDIASEGDIARRHLSRKADATYLETGNSLLASLGKQGRDFFDLVVGMGGEALEERDLFVDPGHDTLLASIQSDILSLEERTRARDPVAGVHDPSLKIHSCHSAMREVEVLHDQLLSLFSRWPDLEPSDVVVMTPDIEGYAPYVEAVFATAEPRIPFNISDRSSERESTVAATFMALLELRGSRYDANQVLAILDEAAVRRRFGLSEGDVETARGWVRDSQIRWGIDGAHRASFGLPATYEHTWRFGLERLLLGYALPGGNERLLAGILPYDEIEGSLGAVLGRFASYAEGAIALDAVLAGTKPVARWCEALHGVLAEFFDPTEERAEEIEAVRAAVAGIDREARAARYTQAVPLAVVIDVLRARLDVPGRAFLSGGVTFCAMVPMRSLPFDIVCMIGMNDRAYPRVRRRDGFDLIADDFRKGDRSRRDDDRYLFLESILNARRCLYVSYTGRHIREDTVMPPSVLVSDLLDYIAGGDASVRERLVTAHPLQAFSRRYFSGGDSLFSYSQTLARAAAVAGRGSREPAPFLTTPLPSPDAEGRTVDLDTFIRFFRNPARHLFEQRLKVRLETPEEELEGREPFHLGGLPLFDLKQRLLGLKLRDVAHDGLAIARAGGDLPHGGVGEALYEAEAEIIGRVARTLAPLLPGTVAEPRHFDFRAGEVTLTGTLANLGASGMVDYRMSSTNVPLRIRAWIRHLALNAFAPPGVGRVSRCVTQQCVLTFKPVADARARLTGLLGLYWQGVHRPLHFFPRTAWARAKGETDSKVRIVWEGSKYDEDAARAECDDPYYDLAFRGTDPLDAEFETAVRTMFAPMLEAMNEEPIP